MGEVRRELETSGVKSVRNIQPSGQMGEIQVSAGPVCVLCQSIYLAFMCAFERRHRCLLYNGSQLRSSIGDTDCQMGEIYYIRWSQVVYAFLLCSNISLLKLCPIYVQTQM